MSSVMIVLSLFFGMALSIAFLSYTRSFSPDTSSGAALTPGADWQQFPLKEKIVFNHNTALYRFALPSPNSYLGLPIGQHIQIKATINDKVVIRSYTPTSLDNELGRFDLVVKTYEKGNISKYLQNLKIGQKILVKGPKGQFIYSPSLSTHLSMIAGGTGISPMYQVIKAAMQDEKDETTISLLYANVTEDDILLKTELNDLAASSNGRFKIHYILNKPPPSFTGSTGFISKELIDEHLSRALEFEDGKILMCGPPPMITAMKVHLQDLGYPAPNTISKLPDKVFCF